MALIVSVLMPQAGKNGKDSRLEPDEAMNFIDSWQGKKGLTLLDLRTSTEYRRGHLSGSVNVDFHGPSFRESLIDFSRNNTYLIYCATGIRSSAGIQIMKNMGFTKVYELDGGLHAWKKAGYHLTGENKIQNPGKEASPEISFDKSNNMLTVCNESDPVQFIRGINLNGKQVFVRNIENNRTYLNDIPVGPYILLMETGKGEKHTCPLEV